MIRSKNFVIHFALIGLLGLICYSGQADGVHETRLALQSAYRTMDTAAAHGDIDKLLSYDSSDYKMTTISGKVLNLTQQKHITQLMLGTAQKAMSTTQIKQIKISGQTAVAVVARHFDFTMAILDQDTGRYDRFVSDSSCRDTWRHASQGWVRLSSQELTYSAKRNGIPIPLK